MVSTTTASEEEPEHEPSQGEVFRDKLLEELIGEFRKMRKEPEHKGAAQESAELFKKHEKNCSDFSNGDTDDLRETSKKLVLVTKQLERQKMAEESQVLGLYDRTRKLVLKAVGKPENPLTCEQLIEEKMGLAEQFKHQLTYAKEERRHQLNQIIEDKIRMRELMAGAIKRYFGLEDQLKDCNALYGQASQQLESTMKKDEDYEALANAKDEIRRRIENLVIEQKKAKQDVVYNKKNVDILHNHEGVMTQMCGQLELLANATQHKLVLAYTIHGLSNIYRKGKTSIEVIEAMGDTAMRCIDIEKETKEISDIVMKSSIRSQQSNFHMGRIGRAIGRYRGRLNVAAENINAIDQEANDIINSYGE